MSERVAIVKWAETDGIASALGAEMLGLGWRPLFFYYDQAIPENVDMVLTFAPYGRFLPIVHQIASLPGGKRPIFVHWNFESHPHPGIPQFGLRWLCDLRSRLDRLHDADSRWVRGFAARRPLSWFTSRSQKFRFLGDCRYAVWQGCLDLLVESSQVFAQALQAQGLPAVYVPWGTSPEWHADLALERDVDVLWMGKRRTRRRSRLLDRIRNRLAKDGVELYVADNVEHPFVFGEERTQLLNRAKITLNILPTWYDPAFTFRFHVVAGNRSLVVSEPVISHSPGCEAGKHFVSTPVEALADTVLGYLEHERERHEITERAYRLVSEEFTLHNSVKALMAAAFA